MQFISDKTADVWFVLRGEGGGQDCEVARLLPFDVVQYCKVRNTFNICYYYRKKILLSASHYCKLNLVGVHSPLKGSAVVATWECLSHVFHSCVKQYSSDNSTSPMLVYR